MSPWTEAGFYRSRSQCIPSNLFIHSGQSKAHHLLLLLLLLDLFSVTGLKLKVGNNTYTLQPRKQICGQKDLFAYIYNKRLWLDFFYCQSQVGTNSLSKELTSTDRKRLFETLVSLTSSSFGIGFWTLVRLKFDRLSHFMLRVLLRPRLILSLSPGLNRFLVPP